METLRIEKHPILGQRTDQQRLDFLFNGAELQGYSNEPIAAALLAYGIRILRKHEESGSTRGFYCAIGHCMECRVFVQGLGLVRSCLTPISEGMRVTSSERLPNEITGRKLL